MNKSKKVILTLGIVPTVCYILAFWISWKAAGLGVFAAITAHGLNAIYAAERKKL